MKLLRHVLSHLFLMLFLIALVSIFYYRTLLFPVDMVKKINGYVNKVYPAAISFASGREYFWSKKNERVVTFDDLNNVAVKEEQPVTGVAVVSEPEPVKDVSIAADSHTENNHVIVSSKEVKVVDDNAVNDVRVADEPDNSIIEVKDSDTGSERELLISARKAFNSGDIKKSEKTYLELSQLDQDNPDTFGELGNVYYSQGKWDEAGQAYYEAAVRLLNNGNHSQVVYLQRVIRGLNAGYAEKLEQMIARQQKL